MTDTKPATDPAEDAGMRIYEIAYGGFVMKPAKMAEIIRQAYQPILAAAEEMAQALNEIGPYFRMGNAALSTYRTLVPKENGTTLNCGCAVPQGSRCAKHGGDNQ